MQGAGGIGAPGTFCKLTDARAAQPIIDAWCAITGAPSAIDTSNLYGFGTSEKVCDPSSSANLFTDLFDLGNTDSGRDEFAWVLRRHQVRLLLLKWAGVSLLIGLTRLYPLAAGDHSPERLRAAYAKSFESLEGVKVRVLYLHA